jgi:glucokinase
MILAGDIGGTHTRLALFAREGEFSLAGEKTYPSRKYAGLEEIVQEFLQGKTVSRACFGVAGPVVEGRCKATNLPWIVDAAKLSKDLGIASVSLLNDLEANAYGLRALKEEDLYLLQSGKKQVGNRALIAAGTGLGEAGLYWDGKEHRPFACEGGHADFAPRNEEEMELLKHLQRQFDHVSCERVVSGPGILSMYRFLVETGREKGSKEVEMEMKRRDPPAVISEFGREKRDRACARVIEWFLSLYGAEAGNLALKIFSIGGLYIGGGIAPHLIELLKTGDFRASFANKGRFKELLESVSIYVIRNDNTALLGAAVFGRGR